MNKVITIVFGVALLAMTTQANAVLLSMLPASQTAESGDTVSLDLIIGDLTDGGADSLGDFDIDIAYDDSRLSFMGYTLGGFLGDLGLGEAVDFSGGDLGGGIINLAEVSLLEPDMVSCFFCLSPYLDDIQPSSFIMATLDFMVDVLPVGTSTTVSIDTVHALGDGFGDPLAYSTSDAVIRNPSIVSVPTPAVFVLFAMGFMGLTLLRQRRLEA